MWELPACEEFQLVMDRRAPGAHDTAELDKKWSCAGVPRKPIAALAESRIWPCHASGNPVTRFPFRSMSPVFVAVPIEFVGGGAWSTREPPSQMPSATS